MASRRKYRPINAGSRLPTYLLGVSVCTGLLLASLIAWRELDPPDSEPAALGPGTMASAPPSGPFTTGTPLLPPTTNPPASRELSEPPASPPTFVTNKLILGPRPGSTRSGTNAIMSGALGTTLQTTLEPGQPRTPAGAFRPRSPRNTFEIQLALARRGLSPGSLDGVMGPQTRAAVRAFQIQSRLPITGNLDPLTRRRLTLGAFPFRQYQVTSQDIARLRVLSPTWLGKSEQDRLDYETVLELVAEKGRSYPNYIRHLNPQVDWQTIEVGTPVRIPRVEDPPVLERAAFIKIFLGARILQAYGLRTNLIAHFPCSIASRVSKRPLGRLEVEIIVENPNYTFNPAIFPESAEGRRLGRKLVVPPGPNNPVGLAWIGLNKPGYGIHGTPKPEKVGRTESHGCFRLANWNAAYLARLVWKTMPVYVEP